MISVILSGGVGSRFWPLSTKESPKQFLKIFDNKSLFDLAIDRLKGLSNNKIVTVSNKNYEKYLEKYEKVVKLYEPYAKNTFGAFLILAKYLIENNMEDESIAIYPSDHMIIDKYNFQRDIINSIQTAVENNIIIVLGIKPTYPEIGYGYIKTSRLIDKEKYIYGVKAFIEKPELDLAKYYIKLGGYFWNCGITIGKLSTFLRELEIFQNEIYNKLYKLSYDEFLIFFKKISSMSLEEAILEKSRSIAMIRARFDWSDLGSWKTYFDYAKRENRSELIEYNSNFNNVLTNKKTVLIDVNDITVIDSKNGILIMKNGSEQKLKDVLKD